MLNSIGLQYIRKHLSMFTCGAPISHVWLAQRLLADMLCANIKRCLVSRYEEWTFMSSDIDWIEGIEGITEVGLQSIFERIMPFPLGGPNACRSEVLVASVCDRIITATGNDQFVICGDVGESDPVWGAAKRLCYSGRFVGFVISRDYVKHGDTVALE